MGASYLICGSTTVPGADVLNEKSCLHRIVDTEKLLSNRAYAWFCFQRKIKKLG